MTLTVNGNAPSMAPVNDNSEQNQVVSQGTANLPSELANARPSRASAVLQVLIDIVSLGITAVVRHRRAGRQTEARAIQPSLPRADPEGNRSNEMLLAALDSPPKDVMPGDLYKALVDAINSLNKRFAVGLTTRNWRGNPARFDLIKAMKTIVDEGRVVKPEELKERFESLYARHFVASKLNEEYKDARKDLVSAFRSVTMANGLVLNSEDIGRLVDGVEEPSQIETLMKELRPRFEEELANRRKASEEYAKWRTDAIEKLVTASGLDQKIVAIEFDDMIGAKCSRPFNFAKRDAKTGQLQDFEQLLNGLKAWIDAEVQGRLEVMSVVGGLFKTPELCKLLKGLALHKRGISSLEALTLVKTVADHLDVTKLREAANAAELDVRAVGQSLMDVARQVVAGLPKVSSQLGLKIDGAEEMDGIFDAICAAIYESKPDLVAAINKNLDVFVTAVKAQQDAAGKEEEDAKLMLVNFLQSPVLPEAKEKLKAAQ